MPFTISVKLLPDVLVNVSKPHGYQLTFTINHYVPPTPATIRIDNVVVNNTAPTGLIEEYLTGLQSIKLSSSHLLYDNQNRKISCHGICNLTINSLCTSGTVQYL